MFGLLKVRNKAHKKTKSLLQKEHDTTILEKNLPSTLTHAVKFRSILEPEDVEKEEELVNVK